MKLTSSQQKHIADKAMDSANVILATMVIGGIIDVKRKVMIVVGGLLLYTTIFIYTTWLRKE